MILIKKYVTILANKPLSYKKACITVSDTDTWVWVSRFSRCLTPATGFWCRYLSVYIWKACGNSIFRRLHRSKSQNQSFAKRKFCSSCGLLITFLCINFRMVALTVLELLKNRLWGGYPGLFRVIFDVLKSYELQCP